MDLSRYEPSILIVTVIHLYTMDILFIFIRRRTDRVTEANEFPFYFEDVIQF